MTATPDKSEELAQQICRIINLGYCECAEDKIGACLSKLKLADFVLARERAATAKARADVLEEAATVADGFTCGGCGMDGKPGKAIRALVQVGVATVKELTPMSTKAEEIELMKAGKGCLAKAADNEPLFILRAQDRYAPGIIEAWASLLEIEGTEASQSKIREARALAHQMRAWQELNHCKRPD